MNLDFGQRIEGVVVKDDGQGTTLVKPRHTLIGEITGLEGAGTSRVAWIRTDDDERAFVRVLRIL